LRKRGAERVRRSHRMEGVAKTPERLTGSVLRVGSKRPKVIVRPQRTPLDLGAPSTFHGRGSERGTGFRRQLYATPSMECSSRERLRFHGEDPPGSGDAFEVVFAGSGVSGLSRR
jgi:hypothetical protein